MVPAGIEVSCKDNSRTPVMMVWLRMTAPFSLFVKKFYDLLPGLAARVFADDGIRLSGRRLFAKCCFSGRILSIHAVKAAGIGADMLVVPESS